MYRGKNAHITNIFMRIQNKENHVLIQESLSTSIESL